MKVVPLLLVHPFTQQLTSLALWAGSSTGLLLLNRHLLHYSTFQLPFYLALGHAGVALVLGRLLLVVFSVEDPILATNNWKTWLHLALLGAGWATSNVLSYAALQQLSIPSAVFLQVRQGAGHHGAHVCICHDREPRQSHLPGTNSGIERGTAVKKGLQVLFICRALQVLFYMQSLYSCTTCLAVCSASVNYTCSSGQTRSRPGVTALGLSVVAIRASL